MSVKRTIPSPDIYIVEFPDGEFSLQVLDEDGQQWDSNIDSHKGALDLGSIVDLLAACGIQPASHITAGLQE